MNIWAWIEEFGEHAAEVQDIDRMRLFQIAVIALPLIRDDVDHALGLLLHGRQLAEDLEERRWVLFLDHWRAQALLCQKRDYAHVLPFLEPAVEESSQPEFDDFPQRICLHEDLITYYLGTDPERYKTEIENSIAYMESEVALDSPCRNCLKEICTETPLEFGRLDEAEAAGVAAIKTAWPASDYHHVVIAYAHLCRIAYAQQDWAKLKHWSDAGALMSGRAGDTKYAVELEMWQAFIARTLGDREFALQRYKAARTKARHTVGVTSGYYNALCAYYETAGERKHALVARTRELKILAGKGQTALECRTRLDRLRLLAALGRPMKTDYLELMELAKTLQNPEKILAEAATIAR